MESILYRMDLLKNARPIELVSKEKAEGVVCTGPFDDANDHPNDYIQLFSKFIDKKLKLLCANPDIVVDRGQKRVYCAGALAKLYTKMGGESLYFGKPHRPIYDLAYKRMSEINIKISKENILCIGDGILTDIKGANDEKLNSLFITGGLAAEETKTISQPDKMKLQKFLIKQSYKPTYSIGFLR